MSQRNSRGRIVNDLRFEIPDFVDRRIEEIVAYRDTENEAHELEPDSVDIVGFRLSGEKNWHRFFLDATIGFWEEWPADEVFMDFEDIERLDIARRWCLSGPTCLSAACVDVPDSMSRFEWRFESGVLIFRDKDQTDEHSATLLYFDDNSG